MVISSEVSVRTPIVEMGERQWQVIKKEFVPDVAKSLSHISTIKNVVETAFLK
ncbi:hypothetical protein allfine_122 [Escherichia phage allfine]|uniref:Uncharacterized protein n=1 Tax=Escherichia phage allfine TaxID=2696380 RepID=A0A6B9XAD2_9CAUD|nr:hypothetical protein allfine_122 [Escherichia phage allfine]